MVFTPAVTVAVHIEGVLNDEAYVDVQYVDVPQDIAADPEQALEYINNVLYGEPTTSAYYNAVDAIGGEFITTTEL